MIRIKNAGASLRVLIVIAVIALISACAGNRPKFGVEETLNPPKENLFGVMSADSIYRQMGLMPSEGLEFVGHMVFVSGPGEFVVGLLGLSFPNRSFVFHRDEQEFVARYRVQIKLDRYGELPIEVERKEVIRVSTYDETLITTEKVLFQQGFRLSPGTYQVTVKVFDAFSPNKGIAQGTYVTPEFLSGSVSKPILFYEVTERDSLSQPLSILLNTRGSATQGNETLSAYVEGYGFTDSTTVPIEVRDQSGVLFYKDSITFTGASQVENHIIRLNSDSQPLGRLTLAVGSGEQRREVEAIVSFSRGWILTNYGVMIDYLRFFGHEKWVDSLRRASESDQPKLWQEFWVATDPNPSTPENEALELYLARIEIANKLFRDEGGSGWNTDRGEVFITIGVPDRVVEPKRQQGLGARMQDASFVWVYRDMNLKLFFVDRSGFGRYELTTESRAYYIRVLARLRRERGEKDS